MPNSDSPLKRDILALRGDGSKFHFERLSETALSSAFVFTAPPNASGEEENSHVGDQYIYVIEGSAICRVSGVECEIKAGDFLTIPGGAPHSLRTGEETLFGISVIAPPESLPETSS